MTATSPWSCVIDTIVMSKLEFLWSETDKKHARLAIHVIWNFLCKWLIIFSGYLVIVFFFFWLVKCPLAWQYFAPAGHSDSKVFNIITQSIFCKILTKGTRSLPIRARFIIMQSIFSKILRKYTPYFSQEGEIWGVFCEFNLWFIFCCSHWSAVLNIMLYWTAYQAVIYKQPICIM